MIVDGRSGAVIEALCQRVAHHGSPMLQVSGRGRNITADPVSRLMKDSPVAGHMKMVLPVEPGHFVPSGEMAPRDKSRIAPLKAHGAQCGFGIRMAGRIRSSHLFGRVGVRKGDSGFVEDGLIIDRNRGGPARGQKKKAKGEGGYGENPSEGEAAPAGCAPMPGQMKARESMMSCRFDGGKSSGWLRMHKLSGHPAMASGSCQPPWELSVGRGFF